MKISIITATRNCAATVAHCMNSLRQQTYPHIEHLIIDGASTDDTLKIVQGLTDKVQGSRTKVQGSRFKVKPLSSPVFDYDLPAVPAVPASPVPGPRSPVPGPRSPFSASPVPASPVPGPRSPVTVLLSEPDNGIYDAMNKGIALATGDIIGILNADDFYADSRVLARVAAVFEDPAVMGCYGDLVYVNDARNNGQWTMDNGQWIVDNGQRKTDNCQLSIVNCQLPLHRYWKAGSFDHTRFAWGWMPPHPTFFVRRSVYERYGTFRLDMGSAADYELMLRFLLKERIRAAYIPSVLVAMRTGGASNACLKSRLRANRMDRRAWKVNGLTPLPWTILCKPLRKLSQWFVKNC